MKLREFKLTTAALQNKNTVYLLIFLLAIAGLSTYNGLPKEMFPDVNFPIITVQTPYPGNAPIDIENLVTKPIEKEVFTVNGIKNMTSTSSQDNSGIMLEMNSGVNMTLQEYESYEKEIMFIKKQDSITYIIDLQWDFIGLGKSQIFHDLYNINNFILSNITEISLFTGYKTKTLFIENQFIVMTFHYAFHHGFRGLKWLIDIAVYYLIQKPDIESICKGQSSDSKKVIGLTILFSNEYTLSICL